MDIGVVEIRKWHLEKRWLDIGYHYVIKRDGTIEPGRDVEVQGAHVENYNHNSVGICLAGGVSEFAPRHVKKDDSANREAQLESHPEDNFTDIQFRSLYALLTQLSAKYPEAKVQGHRDFPQVAKACPSFDVRSWLAGFQAPLPIVINHSLPTQS